jgi:U3 small nucleolar RNA-associated protein 12
VRVQTLSQKEGVKTEGQPEKRSDILEVLTPLGSLQRQSNERVVTLEYDATGELLGCQPAGKSLELYRYAFLYWLKC